MKLMTEHADMVKAIASIGSRRKTWEADTHIAGCSVINHATLHGDVSLAQDLVATLMEALGNSARRNAFIEWCLEFGPFVWSEKDKVLTLDKDRAKIMRKETAADGETPLNVASAMQSRWMDWKAEAAYKPMDLKVSLARLLKSANERAQLTENKGDKIDAGMLAKLAAIVEGTA